MKQRIIEILENKNMIYNEMKDGNIILLASNRLVSIEFFDEEYAKVYEDTEDFTAILIEPSTVSFDLGYILGVLGANITNGKKVGIQETQKCFSNGDCEESIYL